jgi:hypothetical protein
MIELLGDDTVVGLLEPGDVVKASSHGQSRSAG